MFSTIARIVSWCGEFRRDLVIGFVFSFFSHWFAAAPIMLAAYTVGLLFDAAAGGAPFDPAWVWRSLVLLLVFVAGRFGCEYGQARFQETIAYRLTARDRLAVGEALKRVSLGYFGRMDTGSILSSITTGLSVLENMGLRMVNTFVGGYLNFAVMFVILLVMDWRIALAALAAVAASFVFLLLVSRFSRRNAPVEAQANRALAAAAIEYARGLAQVKSFGQDGASMAAMRGAVEESRRIHLAVEWGYIPSNCLHLLALRMGTVALLGASALSCLAGSMDFSATLMFAFFSFVMFAGIEPISDSAHILGVIGDALDQLEAIAGEGRIDEQGRDLPLATHDIALEHVDFSYEGSPVLHDVSLVIPQGTTCAIVGPSGSGKTTLCNLIARFYDVDAGRVLVGGRDVRDLTCDSLLANVSMVFQNVFLFNDTIRHNIRFGRPDATDEEVERAAQQACCHDFIMALPQGYDTMVGEGGCTLSGGQRQRISIARALLKDAPIVILDEATASVDPENEHLIQEALARLTRGKTVVAIAHRLATVEHADQIVVVEDGRVAQRGTHDELLAQEGTYRRFVDIRRAAEGWSIGEGARGGKA